MNNIKNKKYNLIWILGFGIILFPAVFILAQTLDAQMPVDNAEIQAALEDLSKIYNQPVTRSEQARAICNLEQFLADCAEIGKRHGLFSAEEEKQVDIVLNELKGKVVEDLKSCDNNECLMGVATRLASTLSSKNPALAQKLELTKAKVQEKKVIVEIAKEVGVDIEACHNMDPDTASVDLLRACAKLAKDKRIQRYFPEETRKLVKTTDTALELQIALQNNEYQCGDNTLNGCGNFCLNPAQGAGVFAIPAVCRQIAEKFFGQEGIKQLEKSYIQVQGAAEYYKKKAGAVSFVTQDGRTLTNSADIGRYMEGEMEKGNVEAIEKGTDFMVTRGFVLPQDREFAVNMARKIREQGRELDFDECTKNPQACDDFIPDDRREEFEVMEKVHLIITEEMKARGVPDPFLCESDPQYGEVCVKGAEAALPKIKEIAKKFPEARFIVNDIERKISFGQKGLKARSRVEEEFRQGGTEFKIRDQVFSNFGEMDVFCRENGSLCLVETAKKGFIEKDYAANKYEQTFEVRFGPAAKPIYGGPDGFPGAGPYPGFVPPGQASGFTAPGPGFGLPPGFNKEEALKQFQAWLDNPVGAPSIPSIGYPGMPYPVGVPYPSVGPYPQTSNPYYPNQPSFCPNQALRACSDGQYRPESRDQRGCPVYGECVLISQTLPSTPAICPAMPTVEYCPSGQRKVIAFSSPECGTYYNCVPENIEQPQCPSGQYWNGNTCVYKDIPQQCPSGYSWFIPPAGGAGYCQPTQPVAGTCTQELINFLGSGCHSMGNAYFDDQMAKYVFPGANAVNDCRTAYIQNCTVGSGPTPIPSGSCYSITSESSCKAAVAGCVWYLNHYDGTHCDDQAHGQAIIRGCAYTTQATCSADSECVWNNGCQSKAGEGCKYFTQSACDADTTCKWANNGCGTKAQCNDGIDNDGDNLIDYPADTGCYDHFDNNETSGTATPPSSGCDSQLTALLGTGCHQMYTDSSGNLIFCDELMAKSAKRGDTVTTPGCTSPGGTGTIPSSDQKEQVWNLLGLRSWIKANADPTRIEQLKQSCANVPSNFNIWMPSSGDPASPDFGMPNPSKCQLAASCASNQYFDGANCVSSTTPPPSISPKCSDGIDNDGDNLIDYPADTGCYGPADENETPETTGSTCPSFAHDMSGYCMLNSDTMRCAEYYNASNETNYTNTVCQQRSGSGTTGSSTTTTTTTCPSGQSWNGSACVSTAPSGCSTPSNCFDSLICTSSGWYWYSGGCWNSPQQSSVCGNSICESNESPASCSIDCGPPPSVCGDGTCNSAETYSTCPGDCPPPLLPLTSFNSNCPQNHDWNGFYCVAHKQSLAHFLASIRTATRQFAGILGVFLRD